jgi:hypothetical protein
MAKIYLLDTLALKVLFETTDEGKVKKLFLQGKSTHSAEPSLPMTIATGPGNLSKMSDPWDFPDEKVTFTFPALDFESGVSDDEGPNFKLLWEELSFDFSGDQLSFTFKHLKLTTALIPNISIECDLHFVFKKAVNQDPAFQAMDSYIHLYQPDANHTVQLAPENFIYDPSSVSLTWKEPNLNYWFAQLMPGFFDESAPAEVAPTLAIHHSNGEVDEISLEWIAKDGERTIVMPGLRSMQVPSGSTLRLALGEEGQDLHQVTLSATLANDQEITARSTFSWMRGADRELLNDGKIGSLAKKALVEVKAAANGSGRVTIMKYNPYETDPPTFLDQTGPPKLNLVFPNGTGADSIHTIGYETLAMLESQEFPGNAAEAAKVLAYLELLRNKAKSVKEFQKFFDSGNNLDPKSKIYEGWEIVTSDQKLRDSITDLSKVTTFTFPFLNLDEPQFFQSIRLAGLVEPATPQNGTNKINVKAKVEVIAGDLRLEDLYIQRRFNVSTMAFDVEHEQGIYVYSRTDDWIYGSHMGLRWRFKPNNDKQLFTLITKDYSYQLKQADGAQIELDFTRASEEPLTFTVSNFALTEKGITLTATVSDKPVRLNGIDTRYRFEDSYFQIVENVINDFSLFGSGPLPPDLVGEAIANITLQFHQQEDGTVTLVSGAAELDKIDLLRAPLTRFEFAIEAIELRFVETVDVVYEGQLHTEVSADLRDKPGAEVINNAFHLYFNLSGTAQYVPHLTDDPNFPLAPLQVALITLESIPLAGNARVLKHYIDFLTDLPEKVEFDFLGVFTMEIRAFGFLPRTRTAVLLPSPDSPALPQGVNDALVPAQISRPNAFGDDPAMIITGQVFFSSNGGDNADTVSGKVDFHGLYIGLPRPDKPLGLPRLHFKDLSVEIKFKETFALSATVSLIDSLNETGFSGEGTMTVKDYTFAAAFAFLRVRQDELSEWKRAWFIFLEMRDFSVRIPYLNIFLREIGAGFGYRYTLASIKTADLTNDIAALLAELRKLSRTQGDLSKRDRWSVDLEKPGEDPRWTIVLRALFSQTSAEQKKGKVKGAQQKQLPKSAGDTPAKEVTTPASEIPCMFIMDAIIAVRSDLTFFMAARAWMNTNYSDYKDGDDDFRENPVLSGYVILSPRKKRFLAQLSSNPKGKIGGHPPVPYIVQRAFQRTQVSATLLIEPGLFHLELGWPNMLTFSDAHGPLTVDIRAGFIFRVTAKEMVIGMSLLAKGVLVIHGGVDLGIVGVSVSARAAVAYGARYIGAVQFADPLSPVVYGAIGLELRIEFKVEFWIDLWLFSKEFTLSMTVGFTASLEIGLVGADSPLPGLRGHGTLSVSVMGHRLNVSVNFGLNEGAVDTAFRKTAKYLDLGLEATDVQKTLPGVVAPQPVAVDDAVSTPEETPVIFDVLINDKGVDGESLRLSVVSVLPADVGIAKVEAIPANPHRKGIQFTPAKDFTGSAQIRYQIEDSRGGKATARLTVAVLPVNDIPLAVDDAATTTQGEAVIIDVLANDKDKDNTRDQLNVTIESGPHPAEGLATVNDDNNILFTPTGNFTGTVSPIVYRVSDGQSSAIAIVNIVVKPKNREPVPVTDGGQYDFTTNQNRPITFDAQANFRDPEGDRLTTFIDQITPESAGTAVVTGVNGAIRFTPEPEFRGEATIDYGVVDQWGGVGKTKVTIKVVAVTLSASTFEGSTLRVVVLEDVDESEREHFKTSIITDPTHGMAVVDDQHGLNDILYKPNDNIFDGISVGETEITDTIEYKITDIRSDITTPGTLTITVHCNIFHQPDYNIFVLDKTSEEYAYFVLFPKGEAEPGFLPMPPSIPKDPPGDFSLPDDFTLEGLNGAALEQYDPQRDEFTAIPQDSYSWKANWKAEIIDAVPKDTNQPLTNNGKISLADYLVHAFKTRKTAEGPIVAQGDPDPVIGDPDQVKAVVDERVQNPTDDAFEAAVRGAIEQFQGSPFFKHDPNIEYDRALEAAFSDNTTVYAPSGTVPAASPESLPEGKLKDLRLAEKATVNTSKGAHELRGMVIQDFVADLRDYVAAVENKRADLAKKSIPFQMGLVFRVRESAVPGWLERNISEDDNPGPKIKQRKSARSTAPDGEEKEVSTFNIASCNFSTFPPQFQNVRPYSNARTIAIAWDLNWETPPEGSFGSQADPEHHLLHYQVRRRALDGRDPEQIFTVKNAETLQRDTNGLLKRLKPRFQIVDHFTHETKAELAALPVEGRGYLYTITPVDFAGNLGRPLSLVATRYPDEPPQVPADAVLTVAYRLAPAESAPVEPLQTPPIITPHRIQLTWSDPPALKDTPQVPVAIRRLIFRKRMTLPLDSYGLDGAIDEPVNNALPTSNARPLPTDIKIEVEAGLADTGQRGSKNLVTIENQTLIDKGILPAIGERWRPEAWTVFIQTESVNGVPSALAPVGILLQAQPIENAAADKFEERRPAHLEWLPRPIALPFLPPEDQRATVGRAHFPMPLVQPGYADLQAIGYRRHPAGTRCIRLRWNQGASQLPEYPLHLNAGYHLLQLDIDAHTTVTFADRHKLNAALRQFQEVQMLPANDLLLEPGSTRSTSQWEAWYPSEMLRRQAQFDTHEGDASPMGAWYSWRDSILEWPQWPTLTDTNDDFGPRDGVLHPLLQALIDHLSGERDSSRDTNYIVDQQSTPPPQPGDLKTLLTNTAPKTDPYGWSVLQQFGLSIAFTLRERHNNQLVVGQRLLNAIRQALDELRNEMLSSEQDGINGTVRFAEFFHHLHVELLFQPGRSVRLEQGAADQEDLLALVQLSLRPAIRQVMSYGRFYIEGGAGQRIDLLKTGSPCTLINLTDSERIEIDLQLGDQSIRLSEAGRTDILIRARGAQPDLGLQLKQGLNIAANVLPNDFFEDAEAKTQFKLSKLNGLDDTQQATFNEALRDQAGFQVSRLQTFPATDPLTKQFSVPANIAEAFAQTGPELEQWRRFKRYAETLNRPDPSLSEAQQIRVPVDEGPLADILPDFLTWAQRFFDASGEVGEVIEDQVVVTRTLDQPWLVTAYPVAGSPVYVSPDKNGRLKYDHLISDQYAHNFRYFIRPYGRYDLLWQSFRQSRQLFPDGTTLPNGFRERPLALPEVDKGGLDVVLDRIKPVSMPVVLSSARLDAESTPANPASPGKTWEVIIARHPEQILSERNQTLFRRLSFRQIAFTLLRRFAFRDWIGTLERMIGNGYSIPFKLIENQVPDIPNELRLDDFDNLGTEEARSLALPKRIGKFQQGGLVLQWEALPYFYEHRLLLIAQTTGTVSRINDVIQRDFEYRSPDPNTSLYSGLESSWTLSAPFTEGTLLDPVRIRLVEIPMLRFWDCLPVEAQKQWDAEKPDDKKQARDSNEEANKRKLSALPDPEVIYQIVEFFSGNIEVQVEFYFDRKLGQFAARQLGQTFLIDFEGVQAPADESPHADFVLRGKLLQITQLTLGRNYLEAKASFKDKIPPHTLAKLGGDSSLSIAGVFEKEDRDGILQAIVQSVRAGIEGKLGQDLFGSMPDGDEGSYGFRCFTIVPDLQDALPENTADEGALKIKTQLLSKIEYHELDVLRDDLRAKWPYPSPKNDFHFEAEKVDWTGPIHADQLEILQKFKMSRKAYQDDVGDAIQRLVDGLGDAVIAVPYLAPSISLEEDTTDNPDVPYDSMQIEIIDQKDPQSRTIKAYDSGIATVDRNWDPLPDTNSRYLLIAHAGHVQATELASITFDATASMNNVDFGGMRVEILDGAGAGQERTITHYDTSSMVAEVMPTWDKDRLPDETSRYRVIRQTGKVQAASNRVTKEQLAMEGGGSLAGLDLTSDPQQAIWRGLDNLDRSIADYKVNLRIDAGQTTEDHFFAVFRQLMDQIARKNVEVKEIALHSLRLLRLTEPLSDAEKDALYAAFAAGDHDELRELFIDLEDRRTLEKVYQDWFSQVEVTKHLDLTALENAELRARLEVSEGNLPSYTLRYHGLMTFEEAQKIKALFETDQDLEAVQQLFEASLKKGLQGRQLQVRTRKGSAKPSEMEMFVPKPINEESDQSAEARHGR